MYIHPQLKWLAIPFLLIIVVAQQNIKILLYIYKMTVYYTAVCYNNFLALQYRERGVLISTEGDAQKMPGAFSKGETKSRTDHAVTIIKYMHLMKSKIYFGLCQN